jgi:hypothetical protein
MEETSVTKTRGLVSVKELSTEVKYLAVTLHLGFTWQKLLYNVINMAYKALLPCRGTLNVGPETEDVSLDIHPGCKQTTNYLCYHCTVTYSKI